MQCIFELTALTCLVSEWLLDFLCAIKYIWMVPSTKHLHEQCFDW